MIGFQRNEGIKSSLGLGEFDPLFKELKEGLDRYFLGKEFWTNMTKGLPRYDIHWEHQVDRGGGNCHAIAGVIKAGTNEHPMNREAVMTARYHLKSFFNHNSCKMISVDRYPSNKKKLYQKYGVEDKMEGSKGLIVIKYSKMK